jgi:peroxiredoxin
MFLGRKKEYVRDKGSARCESVHGMLVLMAVAARVRAFCIVWVVLLAGPAAAWAEVQPGDSAPEFSLPVIANAPTDRELTGPFPLLDLSSYHGRVVYLDFWAVSCRRCRAAMPQLSAMRETFDPHDVEVLAVSTDTNPRDALAYLDAYPVSYPVVSDPAGTLADSYGVRILPTAFLIARNGKVEAVIQGAESEDIAGIRARLASLSTADIE